MTPEAWIATILLVFVGIIVTIAWFAPTGYQNSDGFHLGDDPYLAEEVRRALHGPTHDFPGRDSGR